METAPEVSNEQAVIDEQEALINALHTPGVLLNREISEMHNAHHREMEETRRNHERQMEMRRVKTEMVKVATDTLTSNARSKPVDARDVTALDIKTFADELVEFINQQ